jgi:3-oxosteroid 1-dehydrogenase
MADFDESFDLVIIGSGAASVTAALTAKERGATSVIIEKQNVFGGSTSYSGGVAWVPNTVLAKGDDSEEDARTYLNTVIERAGDPGKASPIAKREMFIKQGPEAIQFLLDHGVKMIRVFWSDYYSDLPGGNKYGRALMAELFNLNELGEWKNKLGSFYGFPPMPINSWEFINLTLAKRTWKGKWSAIKLAARFLKDKITGSRTVGSGIALQGRMLQAALKANIPIKMSTEMVGLVIEDGRVTGVRVKDANGEKTIGANRGVLLNTGGFSHNLEMRQKYQPAPASVDWTMVNPGDTGEGIRIAQDAGAAVDVMNEAWWTPGSLMPDGKYAGFHVPGEAGKPHIIIVDKAGRRIGNEVGSYMEFGQKMYARGAVPAYAILEGRALSKYTWGPIRPGTTIQSMIDIGYIKRADTIEDLARQMGIDPEGLKDEVRKFNGFAAKGVDEDYERGASFHNRSYGDPTNKPNACLGPIEKPPFYAVEIWPLDVGTSGGVVTDEYARVMKEDGSPIPGLYAAGNATAPVGGRSYPGAGASIGGAITWGHVAAKHATGWNA